VAGVIVGIGTDVVAIERLAAVLQRTPHFLERVFTPAERGLPLESLAARWAAKEAVAKALGVPDGLSWQDCQITNEDDGRPVLDMWGTVAKAAAERGVRSWHVTLTHDAGVASAVVVAEG
jgi:holo-[acyl-carrier protein] synthase